MVVIGARGTLAGVAESRVGFQRYTSGLLPIMELVDSLRPEIDQVASVSAVAFPGDHLTLPGLCALSRSVDEALRHAAAVVVTTGTNELSEVAYHLDLTVRSPKPVVVTGAMRPWNTIGSDGPANLYNAVVLAASGRTAYFGGVVMLNDEILAARDATKTDTQRLHTFRAHELGCLGTIDGSHVRIMRAPERVRRSADLDKWRTPYDLTEVPRLPKVEIAPGYLDAGAEAMSAMAEAGTEGIIVTGALSRQQKQAARTLAEQGVIVAAAGNPGSGAVYPPPEVISAGDLHPQKARLLLALSLALTRDPGRIQQWFCEYGMPQFT